MKEIDNNEITAAPAEMQEHNSKPNVQTETHATKTPSGPGQPALTGGVSSPVLCSASSGVSDKHPIGWKIDFLDGEGNEIEMESFTYAFNPSDGTHRLEMILEESLRSFDIKAFARITPRGFSGVLKGKSMVILSSGEKLERDIYDLSSIPKCNSLT